MKQQREINSDNARFNVSPNNYVNSYWNVIRILEEDWMYTLKNINNKEFVRKINNEFVWPIELTHIITHMIKYDTDNDYYNSVYDGWMIFISKKDKGNDPGINY